MVCLQVRAVVYAIGNQIIPRQNETLQWQLAKKDGYAKPATPTGTESDGGTRLDS
jgi:hypothetical protein